MDGRVWEEVDCEEDRWEEEEKEKEGFVLVVVVVVVIVVVVFELGILYNPSFWGVVEWVIVVRVSSSSHSCGEVNERRILNAFVFTPNWKDWQHAKMQSRIFCVTRDYIYIL